MPTSIRVTAQNINDESKALQTDSPLNESPKEVDKVTRALVSELREQGYTVAPYVQVTHSRYL